MVLGRLAHVTPSIFFSRILRSEALVYNLYFFSEQPFYGNYSALAYHTNTVISHACLLVKLASKSVTRSIKATFGELTFIIYFNNLFTNLFCTRCLKERQKSESIV